MRSPSSLAFGGLAALALLGCGQPQAADSGDGDPAASTAGATATTPAIAGSPWPASLNVIGDGYPNPGDPCRRIGESMASADFLDDSAVLVGCPADAPEALAAIGGKQVAAIDGITLVSIPTGDANAGMAEAAGAASAESPPSTQPRLVQ